MTNCAIIKLMKNSIFCQVFQIIAGFLLALVLVNANFCLPKETTYAREKPTNCEPYHYIKEVKRQDNSEPGQLSFIYNDKKYDCVLSDGDGVKSRVAGSALESRARLMNFVYGLGYSKVEAAHYAFSELDDLLDEIDKEISVEPVNASLSSYKNTGKVKINKPKKGMCLDKNALFCDIFNKLDGKIAKNAEFKIPVKDVDYNIDEGSLLACTCLRASFKTYFGSSGEERKNNIRLALSCFDGLVLDSGQTLSFNQTTGERSQDRGYKEAKIIKQGSFINATGGGVCQVSTTIYNSALLADLEILEVHPHSLPVSYVEPCFDAMVNSGSSDLKIKNNTGHPIVFATSDAGNCCLVNIYGCKNNTKIVRKSKKIEQLLQINTEYTKNYKEYGLDKPIEQGEVVISPGKEGYRAAGYLEYIQDGVVVKTKKIRENTYNPTKRVVLVPDGS